MKLWLDEQISPYLAPWIERVFGVTFHSVVDLPVNSADDLDIFLAARTAHATIVTKDSDFLEWTRRLGTPPQVVWLTCGNRSNVAMKEILSLRLRAALDLIRAGDPVVEIK